MSDNLETVSFELGDRILILGGRHDGLKGRIYYIDETLIRVLPDGVSDRLVDLPVIDEDIDTSLGIEELYSISKRSNPAFVVQIDARVGQRAETFNSNGEPVTNYMVKAVDENNDTLLLEDETGAEVEVQCNFQGIPRDEPFAVIRTREMQGITATYEEPEEVNESENIDDTFEDILEEELEKDKENVGGIYEIPSSQRFYPDNVQRNDMIQDMIYMLDPAAQKSPEVHNKIRSLVEQLILLRNSLVVYKRNGEPAGIRPTSFLTLSQLIHTTEVPLSRPVVDANRTLYLDHTAEDLLKIKEGIQSTDPTSVNGAAVNIKYLDKTILDTIDFMKTQLGGIQTLSSSDDELPKWFLSWETLNKQFHSSWTSGGNIDMIQFKQDKEFLRAPLPETETRVINEIEESIPARVVDGLAKLDADKLTVITSDLVQKVGISLLRGLGPRFTRLSEKSEIQKVESGEEGALVNTILFPLSEQRNLGAIRSGQLTNDIAFSKLKAEGMAQILERLEGIPDEATAGGILSIGVGGNTLGNIPLEDWLKAQPLYPFGLGDAFVGLANYGLSQTEFNSHQQDILVDKIQMYRALIIQHIIDIRETSNKKVSELTTESNPFLDEDIFKGLLDILQREPLLATKIENFHRYTPIYKNSDIATFAYLMMTSTDLLIPTLAQVPGPLARERNRAVRENFLNSLNIALALSIKREMSGEEPTLNDCPHVTSLNTIYRIKDANARMQIFAKFLTRFQSSRKDNWIECGVCDKHLVCYHEFLLLQEFLHPREKDALHKELLINFGGGQFQGKYMCKNCGQIISEMEYDTSLEFSDSGAPLVGRAVLDTADADLDEADIALGNDETEMKHHFKTETQNLIYQTAKKIFNMVGINVQQKAYISIVERVESEILKQPSRAAYPKVIDGKRTIDYDIHINRILVGSAAANCLIEVQTNIPGYIIRYKMPGCKSGFTGYPLGNEKEQTGIEYISCAVAGVDDDISPWNLTGFQRMSEKTRMESVLQLIKKRMESLLTNADAQQQLSIKRAHLKELYGSIIYSDQLPEQIPSRFMPTPYNVNDEEVAKSAIVSQAASPNQLVRAWILQAHHEAKENGTYIKDAILSEATCCFKEIQQPLTFWKEKASSMATLPLKSPPRGPSGGHVGIHFKPRRLDRLEGEISPEVMYKIFLKVCYTGPKMGHPHEPGYTNECIQCGFVFAESPYISRPFPPINKELMKTYQAEVDAIITKGKVALETQNIKVTNKTFENVVDASHKAFKVQAIEPVKPIAGMNLFEKFRLLTPEPFTGWRELVTSTMNEIAKLTPNPSELNIIEAYGTISNAAVAILDEFKQRLGESRMISLKQILESNPNELVENIRTYFLIPFKRLITGFKSKSLSLQDTYELDRKTEADITKFMDEHLNFLNNLSDRAKGFTLDKMVWAYARLVDALSFLKTSVRPSYIPGGKICLQYVTTTLVGGILAEFINPNIIPPEMNESGGTIDTGARAPIQIMDVCIHNLKREGLNFTEEQILDIINRRNILEKDFFIKRFDRMSDEEKGVEKMKKNLGLGEWAVGGTKAIYSYDPEQYERERVQRLEMGFDNLQGEQEQNEMGAEGGYDVDQMLEDDY